MLFRSRMTRIVTPESIDTCATRTTFTPLASMSMSLMVKGKLWGIISCHNEDPSPVPFEQRTACEQLAQLLAESTSPSSAGDDQGAQPRGTSVLYVSAEENAPQVGARAARVLGSSSSDDDSDDKDKPPEVDTSKAAPAIATAIEAALADAKSEPGPWVDNLDRHMTRAELLAVKAYWETMPGHCRFTDALIQLAEGSGK